MAHDPPGPAPFTILPCGTTALAIATCHSGVWLEKTIASLTVSLTWTTERVSLLSKTRVGQLL